MSIHTFSTVRGTICGSAPLSEPTTFTGTPRSNRFPVAANAITHSHGRGRQVRRLDDQFGLDPVDKPVCLFDRSGQSLTTGAVLRFRSPGLRRIV